MFTSSARFDVMLNDLKEIADAAANELLDYFQDFEAARAFAEMLLLPHHHHHEKKVKKSLSGSNLLKLVGSASNGFGAISENGTSMMHASASRREMATMPTNAATGDGPVTSAAVSILNESAQNLNPAATANGNGATAKSQQPPIKYQYSFTDSILLDEFASTADFKENAKFKKKGNDDLFFKFLFISCL